MPVKKLVCRMCGKELSKTVPVYKNILDCERGRIEACFGLLFL